MAKNFKITERISAKFTMDFFNIFNKVNLDPTSLNGDLASGGFGLASNVFPARDIQFGLRIEF